jgi:hypothetical protein
MSGLDLARRSLVKVNEALDLLEQEIVPLTCLPVVRPSVASNA